MGIFNKRIFPDQQFADVESRPVQAGPVAPKINYPTLDETSQGTAAVMDPTQTWDPQADVNPPELAAARLFVPIKAPPSPPVRMPRLEPPADWIITRNELIGGGGGLSTSLGFPCHCVVVDNYSNQWLWFPAARRFVPPYTFGASLPLLQATEVGQYTCEAPPTFASGALHATQAVVTTWTAAMLALSSGAAIAGGIA